MVQSTPSANQNAVDLYFKEPHPKVRLVIDEVDTNGHKTKVLHLRKLSIFETVLAKFGFGKAAFKNVVDFCFQQNIVHNKLSEKIISYNETHAFSLKKIHTSQTAQADGLIDPKNTSFEQCKKEEVLALKDLIRNTNPKHSSLDIKSIDEKLFPTQKLTIGDATYYCSKPFTLDNNTAVLALVKIGNEVYPRIFYRSNSQGSWRTMPAINKMFGLLGHIHKGLSESDTQLPFALNIALLTMKDQSPNFAPIPHDIVKTEWFSPLTYVAKVGADTFAWMPENAREEFLKYGRNIPIPPNPQEIKMPQDKDLHPDFKVPLYTQELELPHYGKLTAKVFASKDKSLQYLFYEASDGRAFLVGAEKVKDSPINNYGVRAKAVDLKGMCAPLLEYDQQISPGYEAANINHRYAYASHYANNWNYVRELEIIAQYYQEQGRSIPDRV